MPLNLNLPRFHCRLLRRLRAAIFRRPIGLLELRRAEAAQRRADPGPIVDDLDALEQVQRGRVGLLDPACQAARVAAQPAPRATSAYVVPDFLYSSTAFCLDSAVRLGDESPMARLAFFTTFPQLADCFRIY